ncbi:MAG TPA: hypothetical protein VK094_09650 [Pseudogracilibacillus sp.]|nr:hypothetical protein [Pseudogracilibacillus sp.]
MALEESIHEEDSITEVNGITFVIHLNQVYYFEDKTLDYKKSMFGGGYTLLDT